ncbi:DUF1802 family protein [Mycolicibacterium sp. S2-37]|uniref:DUF1802 family protein n=1 Tax=Mycolicibacterium sp. S2-37 TaxID=2810297 RepID=UPI001A93CC3F|nr:DUF1802 family protein [Mycolicibacterium sp. S2-37]MBO0677068.1 DUF1802 family protein [Mycolicibacterium sp. S2-37]
MSAPALKEWSAAVHALLDGRQTVLLRKGGIGEKRFRLPSEVDAERFLLFPTVAHSHALRVRPEHRDLLEPAACDSTEDALTLRAGADIVASVEVRRPEAIAELEPLHIWTADSIQRDRLDFRPKHRLTALVVAVRPLIEPVRIARLPQYGGCTSWVDVSVSPRWGTPVHDDAALRDVADRVRRSVG